MILEINSYGETRIFHNVVNVKVEDNFIQVKYKHNFVWRTLDWEGKFDSVRVLREEED